MTAAAAGVPMRRVSLNPATFTQGGLIDDVDVTVKAVKWCHFDYAGKSDGGEALTLGVTFTTEDGKDHDQYYSAGDKDFFRPSLPHEDGTPATNPDGTAGGGGFLIPTGAREGLSSSTNAAMFINSLIAAGFPNEVLEDRNIMDAMVGLKVHINQIAQPKRTGLVKRPGQAGQPEREKTTALITRIIAFPPQLGLAAPAGVAPTVSAPAKVQPIAAVPARAVVAAARPTPAAAAPVVAPAVPGGTDPVLEELCQNTLVEMLAAAPGGAIAKKDIATLALRALLNNPLKSKAVPRMFSDDFLSGVTALGVTYDGVTVRLG